MGLILSYSKVYNVKYRLYKKKFLFLRGIGDEAAAAKLLQLI